MARSEKPQSFRQAFSRISLIAIGSVLVIFVVSLLYYDSVVLENSHLIENVNRANDLSISVKSDIDQAAYNLVAGKATPEDSEYKQLIATIDRQLDELEENSSFEKNKYLVVVARRTLNTAEGYLDQIAQNAHEQAPVAENELILEDIHQVTELLRDAVLDFTAYEIRSAEQRAETLREVNQVMAIAQIGVIVTSLAFLVIQNRTMERTITRPLGKMQDMATRLSSGDFSARMEPTPVEELNDLIASMNSMAGQIDSLMKANIEKQKTLRKAEAQILQAQISPHFLYNTLDTIVALAESEQLDEVVTTTIALSSFHRISLSGGNDWIPVSQEVTHIESYLAIQQIRYGSLLEYEINVDPSIMGEYMLKILLQPLVENAIYHGIKNSRKGGSVNVTGTREADRLVFTVQNTGPGMSKETLEKLLESLKEDEINSTHLDGKGYGLFNVNKRIMLFYDVQDGLEIKSSPETGTCVTLRLPLRNKEISEKKSSGSEEDV